MIDTVYISDLGIENHWDSWIVDSKILFAKLPIFMLVVLPFYSYSEVF